MCVRGVCQLCVRGVCQLCVRGVCQLCDIGMCSISRNQRTHQGVYGGGASQDILEVNRACHRVCHRVVCAIVCYQGVNGRGAREDVLEVGILSVLRPFVKHCRPTLGGQRDNQGKGTNAMGPRQGTNKRGKDKVVKVCILRHTKE